MPKLQIQPTPALLNQAPYTHINTVHQLLNTLYLH